MPQPAKMADHSCIEPHVTGKNENVLDLVVRLGICAAFILLVVLAFKRNINWDEFYYLAHIHDYLEGRLTRPTQTFGVHFFLWIQYFPGNEIEQIISLRLVMILFLGLTCYSLYSAVLHLADRFTAHFAVLAFLLSGYTIAHGADFRTDPIAAAFLSVSAVTLLMGRLSILKMIIAAITSALAVLVTIKSILYAPVFLAVLIWRFRERETVLRILAAGLCSMCFIAIGFLWHSSTLAPSIPTETTNHLQSAASTTILKSGLLPQVEYVLTWLVFSFAQVTLAIIAILTRRKLSIALSLILLLGPILSVLFYRNAFPYFFPFVAPPFAVVAACGFQYLRGTRWASLAVFAVLCSGGVQVDQSFLQPKTWQSETVAEVHRLFPDPVPYLDDSNIISSFPNVSFFMSSWGLKSYHKKGHPVFSEKIDDYRPPLLIATRPVLREVMSGSSPLDGTYLLPEDQKILLNSYVHYAGAIWLAGRSFTLDGAETIGDLPFPGVYRLDSEDAIQVNGQTVLPGDKLEVHDTRVAISGPAGVKAKLIWNTEASPIKPKELDLRIYDSLQKLNF